ncbi:hypothetical protein CDV31_004677 [Fusarium ambrosium]|uniref:Uncharacterized protein n=1 Tax=Fusarium ambrosium TaxID=131363 RepID=A0A428UPB6_9HYPO|nr:hypothetical protein CDV31_004677 [Fusarium ambrosium]
MSVSKLYEAAEHVDKQMNKTSGGSQNEQNLDNLELATDDEEENIFPLAWKNWLTEFKQIPFTIPPSHSIADRFYDVRTRKISAHFLRQDGTPFNHVLYSIYVGPVFIDRDSRNRLHQFYTSEFSLAKTRDLSSPAMFSSGLIDISSKPINNKRIKLEEVSKVKLIFTIRGIPIPKDNLERT